jgi:hypothetical protein
MPYKNIVYAKLERRLLNDARWFMMSETSQLNYIRFILLAQETYNKIPKNPGVLRLLFKTNQEESEIESSIQEIKKNFPKFRENKHYYYFLGFEDKTNYVPDKEKLGKSQESPEDDAEKKRKENIRKEEIGHLLDSWNAFAEETGLSKTIKLTDTRYTHIKQRTQEPEFNLQQIFAKIKNSKFLLGDNDRGWKVDFDFVFSSKNNYVKILEGKYDSKHQQQSSGRRKDYVTEQEYQSERNSLYEGGT